MQYISEPGGFAGKWERSEASMEVSTGNSVEFETGRCRGEVWPR